MSTDDENNLLEGLLAHDSKAVEAIYRENFKAIQAFIAKNNGSLEDARDVFQEAVIVLFQNAQSDSFELTSSIGTYLFSIARRMWLKRLKREKMMYPAERFTDEEGTIDVSEDIAAHELEDEKMQLMEDALKMLGEPCKSLLEKFYIQKKSMMQIADEFGYTNADNAKTQKYKCLARLKKIYFSIYKNGD